MMNAGYFVHVHLRVLVHVRYWSLKPGPGRWTGYVEADAEVDVDRIALRQLLRRGAPCMPDR